MKKIFVSGVFILFCIFSSAQNLDLLITIKGDSIACKIDSIVDKVVYYQMKSHDNWIQTSYGEDNFAHIKYDCINPSGYAFQEGTTIINGYAAKTFPKKYPGKLHLETASQDELNFYLGKAKKIQKTGIIMLIAGPLSSGTGILIAAASYSGGTSGGFAAGYLMFLAGIGTTAVGVPVFITGSFRVGSLRKVINSRDITMELVPYNDYNFQTQNNHYGATLRIRF